MLRQIKMFRLDQTALDDVNQFLNELNDSGASDIDVQVVPSVDGGSPALASTGSATPYIAVFVVYTPKTEPTRRNLGLGPFA